MNENHHQLTGGVSEYVTGGVKTAPPIAVAAADLAGMSLQDWMYVAAIFYTVLQAAHLIYKFVTERAEKRRAAAGSQTGA